MGTHEAGAALIESARAMSPELRRAAGDIEARGTVDGEVIATLKREGFFRILQPARYGGHELEFSDLVNLAAILGQGCGSTAWVYAVGAFHAFNVALFSEQAQDDVWAADPLAVAGSSYVPAGAATEDEGGVRLSGVWPYVSGCDHFDWAVLGARRGDGALSFCLTPRRDYAIEDDWDVTGLRGTGSKSITLDDVFVPAHRLLSFNDARAGQTPGAALHGRALYRTPFFACSSYCLVAPALGIAEGALAEFINEVGPREVRSLAGGTSRLGAHYPVQMRVSEAAGLIDAAKLIIARDCAEMARMINSGTAMPVEQRLRNKRGQVLAVRFVRQAVDSLVGAIGTRGLAKSNRIQMAARDIQAIATHITLNNDIVMPAYGRHILGEEPGIPI